MTLLARRIGFAAAVIAAAAAGTVVGLVSWPAEALRDAVRAIGRTEGGDGRGGARLLDRSRP